MMHSSHGIRVAAAATVVIAVQHTATYCCVDIFFQLRFFSCRTHSLSFTVRSIRQYAYQFFSWSLFFNVRFFIWIFFLFASLTFAAFNLISFFLDVTALIPMCTLIPFFSITFVYVYHIFPTEHASWIIIFMLFIRNFFFTSTTEFVYLYLPVPESDERSEKKNTAISNVHHGTIL